MWYAMGIFSTYVLMFRLHQVILIALVFMQLFISHGLAQELNLKSTSYAEQFLSARGEVIIRFAKPIDMSLDEISAFLSIDDYRNDTITAYANEFGFSQFLELNINFKVVKPLSLEIGSGVKSRKATVNWREQYPSYDDYVTLMEGFAADYPELCQLTEFGTSINGMKLLALKITKNPAIRESEPY
jgi:hypothetical protein